MYVNVYAYVCICVCMYICMYIGVYACMYLRVLIGMCVGMYLCVDGLIYSINIYNASLGQHKRSYLTRRNSKMSEI